MTKSERWHKFAVDHVSPSTLNILADAMKELGIMTADGYLHVYTTEEGFERLKALTNEKLKEAARNA